jgi:hypothetical protein
VSAVKEATMKSRILIGASGLAVMALLLVLLGSCSGGGGGGGAGGGGTPAEISSWAYLDGTTINGINKSATESGFNPQLTAMGSKLYATWAEYSGIVSQIRVIVYNGNDASPSWAFVDGNGPNGINHDTSKNASYPELAVFNTKLYATWREDNGTAMQIRTAVYNGNDASPSWAFVDGNGPNGMNRLSNQAASNPRLAIFNAKLYATWSEFNGTTNQIRAAVYNGNDAAPSWAAVDGNVTNGINHDSAKHALSPQLTVFNSKLYATWMEDYSTGYQIRAAVYNGNDASPAWAFVDGNGTVGINKNTAKNAYNPQLTVFDSKIYATWMEDNGIAFESRVAVYNGNDASPAWTFVDGNGTVGINKDATKNVQDPQLTVLSSKLYATWVENNGTANQIRVAVYSGDDAAPSWTFVDGNGTVGINKNAARNALNPQLTAFASKLYATWMEDNGTYFQIRVAVGQ